MFAAIHAAGGHSCYTDFPGQGHDLWNTVKVYQSATFQQWLFSQTNAPTATMSQRTLPCSGLSINSVPALGGQSTAAIGDGQVAVWRGVSSNRLFHTARDRMVCLKPRDVIEAERE
jgi:hypothetical protein